MRAPCLGQIEPAVGIDHQVDIGPDGLAHPADELLAWHALDERGVVQRILDDGERPDDAGQPIDDHLRHADHEFGKCA